ncbi:MAG: hypothetical protein ACYC0Q_15465, partial [Eubacteriales bacterium]
PRHTYALFEQICMPARAMKRSQCSAPLRIIPRTGLQPVPSGLDKTLFSGKVNEAFGLNMVSKGACR